MGEQKRGYFKSKLHAYNLFKDIIFVYFWFLLLTIIVLIDHTMKNLNHYN